MAFGSFRNNEEQKKNKIAMISMICLFLVAAVAALTVGLRSVGGGQKPKIESGEISTSSKAITALCQPTDYKETCINSLKSANTSDPKELIQLGFQVAVNAWKEVMKNSSSLKELAKDSRTSQALEDLVKFEESCLDEFENISNNDAGEKMRNILQASRELTSNGLAMVSEISSILTSFNLKRRLLYEHYSDQNGKYSDQNGSFFDEDGYPSWVSSGRRKLLAATAATIKPDVVVAKDGSGQFKTITDALNAVPKKNRKTFVIYIKAGVYQETVMVTKNLTKITGNKNYIDGTNTMRKATVSILGPNFIAKDMGFENSAGAIKHQAVALRVQADKSVFYNCQMDGYQDTLYVCAHTQFYRDFTISGTIDFIFGDAAAVFQNCKMVIRKPLDNQSCIVTAQGRNNSRSATGIVLQNCIITGDPAYLPVKNVNKVYLGRPWKEYLRTIIMQSQIDDIIQPEGWLPWMGVFAFNTCWYDEYGNRGSGIKKVDANQANSFIVAQFIKDNWIKPTGVPYFPGMINV
ncbi:hypothetical protein ACOSQ3_007474 [Xanthoceras sorbifolium]